MKKRQQIVQLLVEKGFYPTCEQARRAIMAGKVSAEGYSSLKPGLLVHDAIEFEIREPERFVSRGGYKLEGALEAFNLIIQGKIALDIGASTGGFTDCLLQAGAQKVYAVDVGKFLLDESLRNDPRVVQIDGMNARFFKPADIPENVDIITMDVSFISIKKIIPALISSLKKEGIMLVLVKPQFEAKKNQVGKKGVVHDQKLISLILDDMIKFLKVLCLDVCGQVKSPITGPAGNQEYILWAVKV
ncbi:TlyA family RNA methyltransferase [bacterium]|nr:TlyA family RNA methyltransferase [bacterium]